MKKETLPIYEADLPPTVRNLIRLIGWRAAMTLVKEMPGARIYPPVMAMSDRADARHAYVAELIGQRRADRIYEEYRGAVLEIPVCRSAFVRARDRKIKEFYDGGASAEELCARFGLSRRRVFEILKMADRIPEGSPKSVNSGQLKLFN